MSTERCDDDRVRDGQSINDRVHDGQSINDRVHDGQSTIDRVYFDDRVTVKAM